MPELELHVSVGSTIQVSTSDGTWDFIKPYCQAGLKFNETETEGMSGKDVKAAFQDLWKDKLYPQFEEMVDMMVHEATQRGVLIQSRKDLMRPQEGTPYD